MRKVVTNAQQKLRSEIELAEVAVVEARESYTSARKVLIQAQSGAQLAYNDLTIATNRRRRLELRLARLTNGLPAVVSRRNRRTETVGTETV